LGCCDTKEEEEEKEKENENVTGSFIIVFARRRYWTPFLTR
jgi:hypothetical protein